MFKRLTALVVAVAAIAAGSMTPSAHAAEIGPSAPADVICDSITDQLTISAQFGAGTDYRSQRIAYQLYGFKVGYGWFPLLFDGDQPWRILTHDRVRTSYNPHTLQWQQVIDHMTSDSRVVSLSPGKYVIFIRYAWEVRGSWYDRNGRLFDDRYAPWDRTTAYRSPGFYGTFSECSI